MVRLAALLWVMGGTVLAGVFVVIVLVVPSLEGQAMKLIPIVAGIGYALGIPLALVAARSITRNVRI